MHSRVSREWGGTSPNQPQEVTIPALHRFEFPNLNLPMLQVTNCPTFPIDLSHSDLPPLTPQTGSFSSCCPTIARHNHPASFLSSFRSVRLLSRLASCPDPSLPTLTTRPRPRSVLSTRLMRRMKPSSPSIIGPCRLALASPRFPEPFQGSWSSAPSHHPLRIFETMSCSSRSCVATRNIVLTSGCHLTDQATEAATA